MKRFTTQISILLAVMSGCVIPGLATTLAHRNLQQLASGADRIFVGTCIQAQERKTSQFTYTEYTFEVLEDVKNTSTDRVVLRQYGRASGIGSIIGMPQYEPSQKYLLFLRADSAYGLASPMGFGQGAFRIHSQGKRELAINGFGNLGLFKGVDVSEQRIQQADMPDRNVLSGSRGALNLRTLLSVVREMSSGRNRQEGSQ